MIIADHSLQDEEEEMRQISHLILLALMAISINACATPIYAPGPGVNAATFEPTKARCSLMARHAGGSFAAYGDASYVAGAALGNAIGEAIRTRADFDDCMKANGWMPVTKEVAAARSVKIAQLKGIIGQRHACVIAARAKPNYASLLTHLSDMTMGDYTMTQLTDDHPPTAVEATALMLYWDDAKLCAATAITEVGKLHPTMAAIFSQQLSDLEALMISLVKRQISWGEADQRQKANNAAAKAKLQSVNI
ncbi:MAG: hypothetical protein ABSC06_26335 [Rhodopila sp.]